MARQWVAGVLVGVLLGWPGSLQAKSSGRSTGGPKTVRVQAYTRSDGTRVDAHFRASPGWGGGWGGEGTTSSTGSWSAPTRSAAYGARLMVGSPIFERPKDERDAIEQRVVAAHRKWAADGSAVSQYELGLRHLEGRGVKQDEVEARKWLMASAKQGHNPAYAKLKNHDFSGGVERDADGKIKRSSAARAEFMRLTGYSNGRPGYVIDHIVPLKRGGADAPSNMQWQTIEEARAKDKWE